MLTAVYLVLTGVLGVAGGFIPPGGEGPANETFQTPDYFFFPQVLMLVLVIATSIAAIYVHRSLAFPALIVVLVVLACAPPDMVPLAASTAVIAMLLYSIPVYRSVRLAWLGYGLAVVASMLPIPFMGDVVDAAPNTPREIITLGVSSAIMLLIPIMIGFNAGNRRRYTEAIIDRAHQLARERDQRAQLAVAEERTRIAREMHDVVAHSVSVMVALSEGAARVVDSSPEDAKDAMTQSADAGRSALGQMREAIGLLRQQGEEAELAPAPSIAELPELVQGFREAGLDLTLSLNLTAESVALDPTRELIVYRCVQECLTNMLRYAGAGAHGRVKVTHNESGITVNIEDDGGPSTATLAGLGSGHGLSGLGERVRVVGGTLEYGPKAASGWTVTAVLPREQGGNRG